MKEIIGVILLIAETILIFYLSHVGYQIISGQREKLGPIPTYGIGVLYVGGMIWGFHLVGASFTTSIAMLYLIYLIAVLTTSLYEMFKTPLIVISKPEIISKKNIFINILTQIIIISILLGLIVLIVAAGYRYYFKGIEPGL